MNKPFLARSLDNGRARKYSLRAQWFAFLAILVALCLVFCASIYGLCTHLLSKTQEKILSDEIHWMASQFNADSSLLAPIKIDSVCKDLSSRKGFHLTILDSNNKLLGDSHIPTATIISIVPDTRPEWKQAQQKGWSIATYYSTTLNQKALYMVMPLQRGLLIRLGAPLALERGFLRASLPYLLIFLLLFSAAAIGVTFWLTRKIIKPLRDLGQITTDKAYHWDGGFLEVDYLNQALEHYVTRIQKLTSDLGQERDRLALIIRRLEEGLVILDIEGRIKIANPSSLRLLNLKSDAPVTGQLWQALVQQKTLLDLIEQGLRKEKSTSVTLEKGPFFPFDLLCQIRPVQVEGEVREFLLTIIDVTEFKNLDRVKTDFVANASHELKTPLSSIKGYAETLLDGALDNPKVREPFVRKIHLNALRLEQLIQNLLHLSRLEVNLPSTEIKPLDLKEFIAATLTLQREALENMHLTATNECPENICINLETRDLELILNNLLSNAIKYNKMGGSIHLGLTGNPPTAFWIENTGAGIPEALASRIFERFFRTDSARASQEGTGLGLAIVKHAVLRYGMSIKVESVPNQTTRFIIDIPASLWGNK